MLTGSSGSGFGRILPGILSDRYGRFNTISTMVALSVIFIFALWYPFGSFVGVLYPFAFLFGFGTGSIISLTPVCVGQICKTEEFGKWFGTCYFVGGLGYVLILDKVTTLIPANIFTKKKCSYLHPNQWTAP